MNYTCDNCGVAIVGTRHHCQGPCQNYDLCGNCRNGSSGPWRGGHTSQHLEVVYVEPGSQPCSFWCNTCRTTINGRRWHCQNCSNYDLCDSCYYRGTGFAAPHSSAHDMTMFYEPGCRPGSYNCDSCRCNIVGLRYRCISGCNDFDLCQACSSRPVFVGMHNPSHQLKAYTEPGSFPVGGGPQPYPAPMPVVQPNNPPVAMLNQTIRAPNGVSINISSGPNGQYPGNISVNVPMPWQQPQQLYPQPQPQPQPQPPQPHPPAPPAAFYQQAPTVYPPPGMNPPAVGGAAVVTGMGPTNPPPAPTAFGSYAQPPASGAAYVYGYPAATGGAAVVTGIRPTNPPGTFGGAPQQQPPPPGFGGAAVVTGMGPTNPPSFA